MTRAERIKFWLGLPALIGTALLALYGAFRWVHRVSEAPVRLEAHEGASRVLHDSVQRATHEMHEHLIRQDRLLEGITRGECIENPRDNLARQGLLAECERRGIRR